MTCPHDAIRSLTAHDRGNHRGPVALVGAHNGTEDGLRLLRYIYLMGGTFTGATIVTCGPNGAFTKIVKHIFTQTITAETVINHRLQLA